MPRCLLIVITLCCTPLAAAELQVERDLAYTMPAEETRTLDVYYPAEGDGHPVVVWIHGGGWRKGDKAAVQQKPEAFVERGYLFVSVNYRFVPDVTVGDMTRDIAKAIQWVYEHADKYGGSKETIFVMGHSAGAHLAALVCTDNRYLESVGLSLADIDGCVPVDTAVYDIPEQIAGIGRLRGRMYENVFGETKQEQLELSPIAHVGPDKAIPPFLVLHVADRADSSRQSAAFAATLRAAGVSAEAVPAKGKTHATINRNLGQAGDAPTAAVFQFLEAAVSGKAVSRRVLPPEYQTQRAEFLHNGVTAHRGNSVEFPENTLPAFKSGIEIGADWLELDIFRTKDGKLVVIHDKTTGRVGDKNLSVPDSTFEELLTVDVAAEFRRRTGKTEQECPPQQIPLLRDVLHMIMQQSRTRVSIQPKADCVTEAVALIRAMKAEPWVGFNDGTLAFMAEVKELAPGIPVFWDRGANTDVEEDIRIARDHGFEALVLNQRGITPAKIDKIKAAGIEVGAWTVNEPATMQRLLEMNIDRLYTDDPRTLIAMKAEQFGDVTCPGTYPHHLQGICVSDDAVYWSFTTTLVKTNREGKVLGKVPVVNHHGDLCFHDGRLYVAVNLGSFNDPQGNADSWVYVYDADTLKEVSRHPAPEVFYGAGGIGVRDEHFFVVGGLPDGVQENEVYEYDAELQFVKKHVIESGHTELGIQTAAFAHDRWWFGCYGNPRILLVTDAEFNLQGRYEFDCALGIEGLTAGRLLSALGECGSEGCTGRARIAIPDQRGGLRYLMGEKNNDG